MNRNALARIAAISVCAGFGLALASCESTKTQPVPAPASDGPAPVISGPKFKPYPLDVCLVSDEDLDSMGGPITRVHEGQEIKFCCKGCMKDFYEDPDSYLAKLK